MKAEEKFKNIYELLLIVIVLIFFHFSFRNLTVLKFDKLIQLSSV
jgi:hypothetical protein